MTNAASLRQIQAANPQNSTWVSANAGSGKTRVLTDRVARLLLQGVAPENILCLTYTKAAASEMQNRLFMRLGQWAMLNDDELRTGLKTLGENSKIDTDLSLARTLFARAVETPGGLKIQTIHSFCSSLLRRFPLEAGVSPQFREMDEAMSSKLRADIVEELANGAHAPLLYRVLQNGFELEALTAEILRNAQKMRPADTVFEDFGLDRSVHAEDALSIAFDGTETELMAVLGPICAKSSSSYQEFGKGLQALDLMSPTLATLETLCDLFLYKSGDKAGLSKSDNFPQKRHSKVVSAFAPVLEPLHAFMDRVAEAMHFLSTLRSAEITRDVHHLAQQFLPLYAQRKTAQGVLDFDDLILRARALLRNPLVAAWVLYRLDGGIDHILVDEAQDTSPAQWDVIEALAEEFSSGASARDQVERTIFVVGDKKQSIYSFQGADPSGFDRMKKHFRNRLRAIDAPFEDLILEHSFRSSSAILRLVDHIFDGADTAGFDSAAGHIAFKDNLPGRVDLWPIFEKNLEIEPDNWTDPIDRVSSESHIARLAKAIARDIKAKLDHGKLPQVDKSGSVSSRVISPGDILILVQRRSEQFHAIIAACKELGLPIAGPDRLRIGAELAVQDIVSLLKFLATPEDDLSLAETLKSPFFAWDEDKLFRLSHGRGGKFLWQALRETGPESDLTILSDLLSSSDFLRPFELIERLLTRHQGRKKLLSALGPEAEDGIDALLARAIVYEQSEIPSLSGFVSWFSENTLDIKRQADTSGRTIRVMTVHGAKGLEAPIVYLPDTADRMVQTREYLYDGHTGPIVRSGIKPAPKIEADALAHYRKNQEEERLRLLYVAMTRAEIWLIVMGAGDIKPEGGSWYRRIEAAMQTSGASVHSFEAEDGQRIEFGNWLAPTLQVGKDHETSDSTLDAFYQAPAAQATQTTHIISPSDLGGAKALPGEGGRDEQTALAYGTLVHLLWEILRKRAPVEHPSLMEHLTAMHGRILAPEDISDAQHEVARLLSSPDLEAWRRPDILVEQRFHVPLGPAVLVGSIDLLDITEQKIRILDIKTNRLVPQSSRDCPEGLLRQLGAYLWAMGKLYPDMSIDVGLLWTSTAEVTWIDPGLVLSAFRKSPSLDGLDLDA